VVYDLSNGKPVGQLEMDGAQSICRQVAFSPDGAWAAAYFVKRDTDGTESIDLHHMTRGKVAKRIKLRRRSLPGNRICWLANSKGILIARDYKHYQVKWIGRGPRAGKLPTWPAATTLVVSPDGRRFYAGAAGPQIHAWDLPTQREVLTSQGHTETIRSVAFFAADRGIVTAAEDGTCRIWDASTGRHLAQVEGPDVSTGLVKAPLHGKLAAWIDQDRVHFIRLDRHEVSDSVELDGKELSHATADAAGDRFLAVTGNQVRQLSMSAPRKPARTWKAGPKAQRVIDAASGIMVATGEGGYVVSDALAGKRLFALEAKDAPAMSDYRALSPTGDFYATILSNQVWVFEVDTGQLLKTFPKLPPLAPARGNVAREHPIVRCVAVSPSGKLLAVGSFRGRVGVYDMYKGELLAVFSGHAREVTALAFSADEKKLVSGSIDSAAIVWDLIDIQPHTPLRGAKPFDDLWEQLATSPAAAVTARSILVAARDASVDALAEKLAPVKGLSPDRVARLLELLDSPRFAQRNAAYEELVSHGRAIVPAATKLRDRLVAEARQAGRQPPAEKIRRLDQLIEEADRPSTASREIVRLGRAVRVLERIGTPKAILVLKKLAQGEDKAHVTALAEAALRRIEYRRQAAGRQ
jgi:WD40 repeat protein